MSNSPILAYQPPGVPAFGEPKLPAQGYLIYWPSINALTQTGLDTGTSPIIGNVVSLDSQPVSQLPQDAIVEVSIAGRGASQWKRTQDNTDPTTDTDAGIIVPTEYNDVTSPWVLLRVSGF